MPTDSSHAPGPPRRRVASVVIGDAEADVQRRGERFVLIGGHGGEQEITSQEAEQLRLSGPDVVTRAARQGLMLDPSPASEESWLEMVRQSRPADELAVLVDTTTIYNSGQALRAPDAPSAMALLDLSVLTSAAILFDRIVIQPERFPPLEEVHDLTTVLTPSEAGDVQLVSLYANAWETLNEPRARALYGRRWAEFLDVLPADVSLDLNAVRTLNHEITWGYSSTGEIAEAFGGGAAGRNRPQLAVALAIHTVRTHFNDAVAGALGLPYLATSVRLPVFSHLANSKSELLVVLRDLIVRTSPVARPPAGKFSPRRPLAAPLLLGLVLERMSRPEDYRGAVEELRADFAGLRAQLRDDRENAPWEEQPHLYLERLTKHLTALGGTNVGAAQDAFIGAAQSGATIATGDPGFVTAALKLVAAVKPLELAHKTYLRLWRPEIYVLISVAEEARRLTSLHSRIEHIWGGHLGLSELDQLARFADLRADPFISPITLT